MSELTWTSEKPTTPGWYWWRWKPDLKPKALMVESRSVGLMAWHIASWVSFDGLGGQWAGPIPEPTDSIPPAR